MSTLHLYISIFLLSIFSNAQSMKLTKITRAKSIVQAYKEKWRQRRSLEDYIIMPAKKAPIKSRANEILNLNINPHQHGTEFSDLHKAVYNQNLKDVSELLKTISPNEQNNTLELTPLMILAKKYKQTDLSNNFLSTGLNEDQQSFLDISDLLLCAGAYIFAVDHQGETVLQEVDIPDTTKDSHNKLKEKLYTVAFNHPQLMSKLRNKVTNNLCMQIKHLQSYKSQSHQYIQDPILRSQVTSNIVQAIEHNKELLRAERNSLDKQSALQELLIDLKLEKIRQQDLLAEKKKEQEQEEVRYKLRKALEEDGDSYGDGRGWPSY